MEMFLPSGPEDNNKSNDESLLIERIRQGDGTAFATLITRYLDDVTRFAFYMTRSRDAADDIAQSVWIWIWEHRTTLDATRPFKPYLFRAVRNRALDERKARAVRDRYQAEVQANMAAGAIPAAVPSPEGIILSTATVRAAMNQLSEQRRLALQLRLIDEMEHAEIAESLGISPAAARQLVHRALVDLQKILDLSH